MLIKCWGARGSTPVSGRRYLKYGGNTTCIELRTIDDEIVVIDAGTGIIGLGDTLLDEKRHEYSILFTHPHWDHVLGFPFFKPIYQEHTLINMYGCPLTQDTVKQMVSGTMAQPHFPVNFDDVKCNISYFGACEHSFSIGSVHITPIMLSHPGRGIGYKFVEDGKSFVFLTDNELTHQHWGGLEYQCYVEFAKDADLLFHDAEYTTEEYNARKTWGHSVYSDALRLALDAKVSKLGLFHHNHDRSDIGIDGLVQHCHEIVSEEEAVLECFAVSEGMEIVL
jgi:phosphoribosyl 1,2-cyclic phosphodiesterase